MDGTTRDAGTKLREDRLDDALDDSFPASDPPSMTDPTRRTGEPIAPKRPGASPDMPSPPVRGPEDRPIPTEDVPPELPPRESPPEEPPMPAEMPPRDNPRRPAAITGSEAQLGPFSVERLRALCLRLMSGGAGQPR
ncbi:hypothetical protein [Elioraea sp.]|uniref:hypothetical protein n=1 Tax=Elioraea sp. TaxID=2185103 RepID=UPI0025BBEF0D|nr:hypothetical protein [Elioraea sp.]